MSIPKPSSHLSGVLIEIDEKLHKADLELLDRYLLFSTEILRLSLAAFAGIGLVIGWLIKQGRLELVAYRHVFIIAMMLSLASLAGAAACSMGHRYFASDGIYYHLRAIKHLILLRDKSTPSASVEDMLSCSANDERCRNRRFQQSARYLLASTICLSLGVAVAGIGVGSLLLGSWTPQ